MCGQDIFKPKKQPSIRGIVLEKTRSVTGFGRLVSAYRFAVRLISEAGAPSGNHG
jgi:hypothetical protein